MKEDRRRLEEIAAAAIRQGWRVERTAKRHYRFLPPDKSTRSFVTGGTPSDRRSVMNIEAQLRRAGLVLP